LTYQPLKKHSYISLRSESENDLSSKTTNRDDNNNNKQTFDTSFTIPTISLCHAGTLWHPHTTANKPMNAFLPRLRHTAKQPDPINLITNLPLSLNLTLSRHPTSTNP
jgi:hypothetical protein